LTVIATATKFEVADTATPTTLASWIGSVKSFVSEEQLNPVVDKTKTDMMKLVGANLGDQVQALLYLTASLQI
jgi:hypothetical protein